MAVGHAGSLKEGAEALRRRDGRSMSAPQTVKELPNERFRREEKCEREPSGFPFTFHHPAAAGKIAK